MTVKTFLDAVASCPDNRFILPVDKRIMEAWLEHLVTQSLAWSLVAVALVALFESLALVGLLLPGTVMMATLGTLIGNGRLGLYPAWGAGIVGCLAGDWISYYLGWRFQASLNRWKYLQKHRALLDKTEHALHQHSMITVLVGRFIGPTRPLIPLVAGMLELPVRKFLPPNIIGCLLWPPLYLLPGILAGVAIDVPKSAQSSGFKWLLLCVALLIWLAGWLCWRWWKSRRQDFEARGLNAARLHWLAPLVLSLSVVALIAIQFHPLMPLYRHLLWQVFFT